MSSLKALGMAIDELIANCFPTGLGGHSTSEIIEEVIDLIPPGDHERDLMWEFVRRRVDKRIQATRTRRNPMQSWLFSCTEGGVKVKRAAKDMDEEQVMEVIRREQARILTETSHLIGLARIGMQRFPAIAQIVSIETLENGRASLAGFLPPPDDQPGVTA